MMFGNSPLAAISLVHFKNNTVSAIIGNIYMHRGIGSAWQKSEVEFTKAVGSLDQFGEVDVSYKTEVHSTLVCCLNEQAPCVYCLMKS